MKSLYIKDFICINNHLLISSIFILLYNHFFLFLRFLLLIFALFSKNITNKIKIHKTLNNPDLINLISHPRNGIFKTFFPTI